MPRATVAENVHKCCTATVYRQIFPKYYIQSKAKPQFVSAVHPPDGPPDGDATRGPWLPSSVAETISRTTVSSVSAWCVWCLWCLMYHQPPASVYEIVSTGYHQRPESKTSISMGGVTCLREPFMDIPTCRTFPASLDSGCFAPMSYSILEFFPQYDLPISTRGSAL